MPEYRVLVEITQTAWYYVEAEDEWDALENYKMRGHFGDYGYEDEKAISAELM